jgi:hypothetical protein
VLSHTVPQRLLRQFAYEHVATKSLRLWKYAKALPPFGKASPRKATTEEKFFADPKNAELELEIETSLAHKIEDPVNVFLDDLRNPSFTLSEDQRKQMTRYVTLLFGRSAARREGSKHTQEILARSLSNFIANEVQLTTVAAHWSMERYFAGRPRLFTVSEVVQGAERLIEYTKTDEAAQRSFVAQVHHALTYFDIQLFQGDWNLLSTEPEKPFIISDAPVTTWIRDESGTTRYGAGFARTDVEVLLPVSPVTCLHIVPRVPKTRPTVSPNVDEVNRAQAAFAYRACYTNQKSSAIDDLVQEYISTARIGKEIFTVWHRQYDDLFYEILMNQGPIGARFPKK